MKIHFKIPPVRVPSATSQTFKYVTLVADKLRCLAAACVFICWLLAAPPAQAQQDCPDSLTSRNSGTTNSLSDITYGNGLFVAVGGEFDPDTAETLGMILTSDDGVSWTIRSSSGTASHLQGVTYGNGIFVAVGYGDDGFGTIVTSDDGVNWTFRPNSTDELFAVAYGNGTFVAVGAGGEARTSTDGVKWTTRNPGGHLYDITYGNGSFVAVGEFGEPVTSTDGASWTRRSSDAFEDLGGITYGNGSFVAVGNSGTIVTSADGEEWTSRSSGTSGDLNGVTYGNGNFVAVGDAGTILTSADGLSWTSCSSGRGERLSDIIYANGSFVAVGSGGTILQASEPGSLLNISTRLRVQTGENVLIGGFIITGSEAKKVIIRAIGPSLGAQGVGDALADPTLELVDGAGVSVGFNDNWKDTQQAEIEASTIPPGRDEESAIVATLAPGNYTAVVRGNGDSTGIGLVEVYDLAQATASTLANISSRGRVETGEDVMIGGFIVGGGARVVVRAIGPSLAGAGVSDALQDPTLQLVDANGTEIRANDNWRTDQQAEIEAIGLQPSDDREAALIASLGTGNYTAVVRGAANGTGVGLVEVYNLP